MCIDIVEVFWECKPTSCVFDLCLSPNFENFQHDILKRHIPFIICDILWCSWNFFFFCMNKYFCTINYVLQYSVTTLRKKVWMWCVWLNCYVFKLSLAGSSLILCRLYFKLILYILFDHKSFWIGLIQTKSIVCRVCKLLLLLLLFFFFTNITF